MLVYDALLSPGGATLRTQPLPASLVGKTYKEARRSFNTTLICGYIRDGQVQLLAKDSKNEVLKAGDKLVTLSLTIKQAPSSPDSKEIFEKASAKLMARGATKKVQQSSKKKIIVVSMGVQVIPDFADDFSEFSPKGSTVTYILPESLSVEAEAALKQISPGGNCKFNIQYVADGNPASIKALTQAGIKDADAVLVAGMRFLKPDEADALVVASTLQVQEASRLSGRTHAPHLVARVHKAQTSAAINDFIGSLSRSSESLKHTPRKPELVQPDQLLASILTQSASDADYLKCILYLLTSATGAEVYQRPPGLFGLPMETPLTFAEIIEAARMYNETAIGLWTASGQTKLGNLPSEVITLHPEDKVVTFASDFMVTRA